MAAESDTMSVAQLQTAAPWFHEVRFVDTTVSTNADLLELGAREPGADRIALLAGHQTGGRGRHGREWVSPPQGQIAMSVLVHLPGAVPAQVGWLPLLTGIAVREAIVRTCGLPATLKWPNDVMINERKVSGILAEVAAVSPEPVVVIGLGVNVAMTTADLPVPHATSLLIEGADVDRTELAGAILAEFAARFAEWQDAQWSPHELVVAYRERCRTLGRRVRAELPGDTQVTGIATDVDEHGRLLITVDGTGRTMAVAAGDVTHLRPS